MLTNLSGKKALVTGAAGGIGKAIVKALSDAGATIAATDVQLEDIPCNAAIPGDLTDPAHCDALPTKAREALDGLDIVINNAGVIRRGVITDSTDDDYVQSMAVNVEAPFRICRAAIPILAANGGGAIVNVSSCWGVPVSYTHLRAHET